MEYFFSFFHPFVRGPWNRSPRPKGEIGQRETKRRVAFVTGTRGIINDVHAPRNDPRGQIIADSAFTRLRSLLGSRTHSESRFLFLETVEEFLNFGGEEITICLFLLFLDFESESVR